MLNRAATPYKIRIIGKANGVGLMRDIKLLSDCLRLDGHDVSVHAIDAAAAKRRRSHLRQWGVKLQLGRSRAPSSDVDLNIMLEHVWSEFLPRARSSAVVPNPEWFDRHDVRFLPHVDHVWAKTQHAAEIFRRLGRHTLFLSFDSEDRYRPEVPRERRFFHLAGKSTMKGTDRLLRLWAQRPDWPTLTVIGHGQAHAPEIRAANIDRREGYLTEDELLQQQNACMFHVCPSLSEGWGHYIVEALSVGAVVLTVAAPPMNELVTEERGLLMPYERVGEQRLSSTYYFCTAGLQAAVERAVAMSDEEWSRMSANARRWFESNRGDFPLRVRSALRESVQ
ncbi:MAG TPA: glycosyltransferase [Steroidobacter sp.]|uniref:glycosyltransferase n=1 Tax=Steroidobacter sp. TaxID=1978227 RepID=UPI002ED90522